MTYRCDKFMWVNCGRFLRLFLNYSYYRWYWRWRWWWQWRRWWLLLRGKWANASCCNRCYSVSCSHSHRSRNEKRRVKRIAKFVIGGASRTSPLVAISLASSSKYKTSDPRRRSPHAVSATGDSGSSRWSWLRIVNAVSPTGRCHRHFPL